MELKEKIRNLAEEFEEYVIGCRRYLHTIPEVSGQEEKTIAFVEQEAAKLGLVPETVTKNGRIFTLDTGRPGNCVALRADIDGLPVEEMPCNLKQPRQVISGNSGVSHACGHDGHIAILLGAMKVLVEMKDQLSGKVLFCFEEGEEDSSAWRGMVEALEEKQVNTAFALHVSSSLEHGLVSMDYGPRLSGMVGVDVTFVGRGGHGSRPDLSINPVFAAAAALNNLAVAFANQIDANETVTLGITSIQGGNIYNVFPDTARVLGTLRYFNPKEGYKALDIVKKVFDNTAAMNNCTVEYNPPTRIIVEPTINDDDAVDLAFSAFRGLLPEDKVVRGEKWYASESFSEYLMRFKGAHGFLGIRNEELGCGAEHHNGYFDLDESALSTGVMCYAAYAAAALESAEVSNWMHK